ncbi:hypothetical protein, partial [Sphaerochaeta sp. S2]|uniref:hypothetical protein n=1 Tax=Sphaerochaeta sp. S2 TaxID=2798868 RepID=UPI001E59D763
MVNLIFSDDYRNQNFKYQEELSHFPHSLRDGSCETWSESVYRIVFRSRDEEGTGTGTGSQEELSQNPKRPRLDLSELASFLLNKILILACLL